MPELTERGTSEGIRARAGGTRDGAPARDRASAVDGDQLVLRVVDEASALGGGEPAGRGQLATGGDARERAAPEPDQRHRARPVEELGLESRHPGAGTDRDGADGAVHGHRRTVAAVDERGRADVFAGLLQLLGVEVGRLRGQASYRPAEPALLATTHCVSVISGPRSSISSPGRPGSGASICSTASRGSRSGNSSRGAIASVPRTTTVPRNVSSRRLACTGSVAAGPVTMPRRNHRGPSTPRKRAACSDGPWPGASTGMLALSSVPNGPVPSSASPPASRSELAISLRTSGQMPLRRGAANAWIWSML